MNIFKRIFKVGQSEAHSALDKLEDPIKMTEQGIRDMKKDLDAALHALAEVKAMAIRARNEVEDYTNKAKDYGSKAMQLLSRAEAGTITAEEGDRLASEALVLKQDNEQLAAQSKVHQDKFDQDVSKMDSKRQYTTKRKRGMGNQS